MKKRYLVAAAVILFILGLYLMTLSAGSAKAKAGDIVTKDTAGTDVTADLVNLETYVHNHMNATIKVELTGSYQRANAAAQAATAPDVNGTVYQRAQISCAAIKNPVQQAACIQSFVTGHAAPGANSLAATLPAESSYIHSYTAPRWTPDLAGLSLLAALAVLLLAGWLALFGTANGMA